MGVVIDNGITGVSQEFAAEAVYEGKVYKDNGSGLLTVITGKADVARAVALSSSIDESTGGAKTLDAGDGHGVALINSGMIVEVASKNSETWAKEAPVYLADDVDGAVTSSTSSSVCIGTYKGKAGLVTTVNLQKIMVMLDRAPGATA